jgi:hypothetical protein
MKTERITPAVRQQFAWNVELAASRHAGPPTHQNLADVIRRAEQTFRLDGDTLTERKLTDHERSTLRATAVRLLEAKYGRAWSLTAEGIDHALRTIPPPEETIADFIEREGLSLQRYCVTSPPQSLAQIDWCKKAVYGPWEIELAEHSVLNRAGAIRFAPAIDISKVAPDDEDNARAAAAVLFDYESFRQIMLEGYVVRSGDVAPDLKTLEIRNALESLTDEATRAGRLDDKGRIANLDVRRGIHDALQKLVGELCIERDTWDQPFTAIDSIPSRAIATDAYRQLNHMLIPAVENYLRSLGAKVMR